MLEAPNFVHIPTYKEMKDKPTAYPFSKFANIQGKDFAFVVSARDNEDSKVFNIYDTAKNFRDLRVSMSKYGLSMWWICHDKDFDDKGELVFAHYHCVISSSKTLRCWQVFNYVCEAFGISPVIVDREKSQDGAVVYGLNNAIQLQKVDNLFGAIAYLVHLNHPEKAQYDIDSVYCNVDDRLILESVITMNGGITIKGICNLVEKSKGNYVAVLASLPFNVAIRCSSVIRNLCKDYNPAGDIVEDMGESPF